MFPVDVSTSSRATLGGMTGNNSCGARSIRYGPMRDNVRAIEAVLMDGETMHFGELSDNVAGAGLTPRQQTLVTGLLDLGRQEAKEIKERFPDGEVLLSPRGGGGFNPYAGYDSSSRPFLYRGSFPEGIRPLDYVVAVDGLTIDGRHIDPFTGTVPDLNLSDDRSRLLNQIHQDYFNRIRMNRNRAYHKPLSEFLQRYHKRTGRPEDELVAFDVYWLTDHNPPLGSITPYDHDKIAFISWRKSRYRRKAGMPKMPRRVKVRKAGK